LIVLDSSFLIAYHNTRDTHHAAAARAMVHLVAGEWGNAVLLEYVFLEVVTVLRVRRGPEAAADVAERLLDAREVEFIACSEFFPDTLSTFRRERASLSFTDAAIVTLARRESKGYVATFDMDFRGLNGITVVPA
jgi:predicted nucleic acid-binding protein